MLDDGQGLAHLQGRQVVGIYPLLPDDSRSETLITAVAGSCQDTGLHREYAEGLPARLERLGDVQTLSAYWVFVGYLA